MISLWVATAYLLKSNSNRWTSMLTALPATFMSAVSSTYICMAKEGLQLSQGIAYPIGIVFALALFGFYLSVVLKQKDNG
jgi:carbon starvation protein CstA